MTMLPTPVAERVRSQMNHVAIWILAVVFLERGRLRNQEQTVLSSERPFESHMGRQDVVDVPGSRFRDDSVERVGTASFVVYRPTLP